MKTLKVIHDTFSGTKNAVCKYGVLPLAIVTQYCGDGQSKNDCWPGAGVRSVITTWEITDPTTICMIKKSCRDYGLKVAAFKQQKRLANVSLTKWKTSAQSIVWARKQVVAGLA